MTEKQKNCIKWICETLNVQYYGKNTKQDAQTFISKFIERAKEVSNESNFFNAWGMSYILGRPMKR